MIAYRPELYQRSVIKAAGQGSDSRENRVLLVCPYRLILEGLEYLFSQEEDLRLVGLLADANEVCALLFRLRPDLVLVVSINGHQDFTEAVCRIKTADPHLPVLLISADVRPEGVQATLAAGANGFLPLDISQDELVRAVYAVCRGEFVLHPSVMLELLSYLADQPAEAAMPNLEDFSPREQEVLACLTDGLSDREIAQQLFISVRTVQTHLVHIYSKLGVHSRVEAALAISRAG